MLPVSSRCALLPVWDFLFTFQLDARNADVESQYPNKVDVFISSLSQIEKPLIVENVTYLRDNFF
jgi:hypothetical protein